MTTAAQEDSVSVVIGAYNASAWIASAIESVLAQTRPVDEIIVVDDGSTDATLQIARSFGSRVRALQEEHRGRPRRNQGIEASRGGFIAFLDADDFWHPDKIKAQLARMRNRAAAWAICDAEWIHADTLRSVAVGGMAPKEGDILESLFLHNFIVASTALISRRVLEDVGGFDETASVAPVEDWDLWLRVAARFPVACVHERLTTVRLHEDSFLASTPLVLKVQSMENVIMRAAAREPRRLAHKRRRALRNAYFAGGVTAFRLGRLREARGHFVKAWRQRPLDLASLVYVGLTSVGSQIPGLWLRIRQRRDSAHRERS